MANEVKITAVGDERDAVRALGAVEDAVDDTADEVKQSGERIRRFWQQSSEDVEKTSRRAAEGIDRLGESADTLDTRAMGARDGLTSLEDGMAGVSELANGNLLQGLLLAGSSAADLGSTSANFVAPTLRDLVTRLGAVRLALLGVAGVGAAAALALVFMARDANRFEVDITHAQEDLDRFIATGRRTVFIRDVLGDTVRSSQEWADIIHDAGVEWNILHGFGTDALDAITGRTGAARDRLKALDDALAEYVDRTGDAAGAEELLRDELGGSNFERALAQGSLTAYQGAVERAAERQWDMADAVETSTSRLKEFTDFIKGQTDPLFRLQSAQDRVNDAQQAYTDALHKFGDNSDEARRAQNELAQAELGVLDATSQVTAINLDWYRRLHEDGLLSSEALAAIEREARGAKSQLDRLDGSSVAISFQIYGSVLSNDIQLMRASTGYWADYGAHVAGLGKMHDGGIVPGTPGQDVLAVLQAGERVLPFDQAGGPGSFRPSPVPIRLSGSRFIDVLLEDLAQQIRDRGGDPGFVLEPA